MATPDERNAYRYFVPITTRWMDNDVYGHVNNVTYYSYFDTAANHYLIHQGGLKIDRDPIVGFVVASSCEYRAPIAFPDQIEVGFRVNRLGRSSVQYGLAIFLSDQDSAVAHGTFTHVFVERKSGQSTPIPRPLREALARVLVE